MSAPAAAGLAWAGLMRAGMRGLGLAPREFWALTPAELALMLGIEAGPRGMDRSRLAELAALYPDAAAGGNAGEEDQERTGGGGSGRT